MTPSRSLLLGAVLIPACALAQNIIERTTNELGQTVTVSGPSGFLKTPPLREWPGVIDVAMEERELRREMDEHRALPEILNPAALDEQDGALQTAPATRMLRAPLVSFNGQNGSGVPPDPTGSVGPDRYVQAVNTAFRVYQKTGTPDGIPQSLSSLWSGSSNLGDPIVMYDRHADRWFISQFNDGPNRMLLAVSETSDPTGAYYTYEYTFSQFPDYPKFSVWWDGYYMTSNSNKTAVVFERSRMLTGDPTARMISLSAPSVINSGFTSVLPADADGDLPPNGTPCYFFNLEDNSWGAPADRIKIYQMNTNWTNTSSTTVTLSQTLNTAAFDPWLGTGWDNISQPNTPQKLDAGLGIFYYRAQHTRWADHSSVMLCHGVDVGSNHCAIRWYELRDANDGNFSIYQQGTWNPDAADRFYGSVAMDDNGNIGLAYSCANDADGTYAGLRYTGRLANDPLGQMTFSEQTIISGTGAQTFTNRFGDYAHMSLDPDGQRLWFTGEYLGTGGNTRTRICSFNLNLEVGVDEPTATATSAHLDVLSNGSEWTVQATWPGASRPMNLDVIGLDGRIVLTRSVAFAGDQSSTTIDAGGLSSGVYFVRVSDGVAQQVQRIVLEK